MKKISLFIATLFAIFAIGAQNVNAQMPCPTAKCPQTTPCPSKCPTMSDKDACKCHEMMMKKLGDCDQCYDLRFINIMIMHHQGGITMAQDALQKAQHPELKQIAQNIITQQTKEIEQLKALRMQWYNQ